MNGETRDRQSRDVRFFDREPRIAQLVEGRLGYQFQTGPLEILEQASQRDVLGRRELFQICLLYTSDAADE